MLNLENSYIVTNDAAQVLELDSSVNYNELPGIWYYVVGGGVVTIEDLVQRVKATIQRYQAYEPSF